MSTLSQFYSGGGASGWPFLFPTLFGSGGDGSGTLTTTADVGYFSAFGVKQYTSASLAAGQTLTVAQASSNGGLVLACAGTLTIAGAIVANGAAGSNGVIDGGGAGGGNAGGGAGGAKKTINGAGTTPAIPTKFGVGVSSLSRSVRGATSGAFQDNNATTSTGLGSNAFPLLSTSTTFNERYSMPGLFGPGTGVPIPQYPFGLTTSSYTGSASGTDIAVLPTTADYGPWAQVTGTGFLSLRSLQYPTGAPGGAVTGVVGQQAAGGGGGGTGGVIYIEANNLVLTAGYSITATGGNGGNGFSSNGTSAVAAGGSAGCGGLVIIVYRTLTGSTAAITANAGSVGTGAGTAAAAGVAGVAGGVYLIKV